MTPHLTNRFKYVKIFYQDHVPSCSKSFTSNLNEIKCGVLQGYVLGPLLFLFFINDLPNALPLAKVVFFADHTNILLIDNSIGALNGKIKKVIDLLESWFNNNKLLINIEKMKALFFHGERVSFKV
jgi:hypothetical protein